MEEQKKGIQQQRDERKKHALSVVLDQDRGPGHFWDALLISNIDNVIDSIEWLQGEISSVETSIDNASVTSNKLSKRIFWLNVILIIIGTLGLLIAGYSVFFK